jgi:hypothetical protein
MKDASAEVGMLMRCGSWGLVIGVKSPKYVLLSIASAIAPTNSREELNEANG